MISDGKSQERSMKRHEITVIGLDYLKRYYAWRVVE